MPAPVENVPAAPLVQQVFIAVEETIHPPEPPLLMT